MLHDLICWVLHLSLNATRIINDRGGGQDDVTLSLIICIPSRSLFYVYIYTMLNFFTLQDVCIWRIQQYIEYVYIMKHISYNEGQETTKFIYDDR